MSIYFIGEEQTLQDILTSREERVEYQKYLLSRFAHTIISYKLNIPGPIKYSSLIKQIFHEGLRIFKSELEKSSMKIENDHISFSAENSVGKSSQTGDMQHSGIGLENVRKRLNLLFPDKHVLKIESTEMIFCVELSIQLKKLQV